MSNTARDENMRYVNQLALKAQAGDICAFEELVEAKTPQIRKIAANVAEKYGDPSTDEEDLFQTGLIVLWKRTHDFKPDKEMSFWTYTGAMINTAMRKEATVYSTPVYIPSNVYDAILQIDRYLYSSELAQMDRESMASVLAKKLEVSAPQVYWYLDTWQRFMACADIADAEEMLFGTADSAEEQLLSTDNPFAAREMRRALDEALNDLTPREKTVVEMYNGLATGEEMLFQEIGKHFSVTMSRIAQIYAKGIRKLRMRSHRTGLENVAIDYGILCSE